MSIPFCLQLQGKMQHTLDLTSFQEDTSQVINKFQAEI